MNPILFYKQLKEKAKLKLVCYVDELSDIHTLLVNIVFQIGAEAIDAIYVQVSVI